MKDNNGDITRQHHQPSRPPPPPFSQMPEEDNHNRSVLIDQIANVSDVKSHQFPLARIKKIIKFDPEVNMVSAEAPILLSKACEMFIADLTNRAWLNAEENKRRTLHKSDISAAVASNYIYDFILDIVTGKNDSGAAGSAATPHHENVGLPVYYPHLQVGNVMGTPVVNCNGMYAPRSSSHGQVISWLRLMKMARMRLSQVEERERKLKCGLGFRACNCFGTKHVLVCCNNL